MCGLLTLLVVGYCGYCGAVGYWYCAALVLTSFYFKTLLRLRLPCGNAVMRKKI